MAAAAVVGETSKTNDNFNFTDNELFKLNDALKHGDFRRMLCDYAREIQDPASRTLYEAEMAELERERGFDCTFLHPEPGFVLKTTQSPGQKVFINICSDANIAAPSSRRGSTSPAAAADGPVAFGSAAAASAGDDSALHGVHWSIPYTQSQPRPDLDKSGVACIVYDVIFHPSALRLAESDPRFKALLRDTALDAVEKGDRVKLDRERIRTPKLKFKGDPALRPTVIRRPLGAEPRDKTSGTKKCRSPPPPPPPMTKSRSPPPPSSAPTSRPPTTSDGFRQPAYAIKLRRDSRLQDVATLIGPSMSHRDVTRPDALVVEICLPDASAGAAGIDLDVLERELTLESAEAAADAEVPPYRLHLRLPYPVDEENGTAKFDKSTKKLIVTLPVKKLQEPVIRLTSTDSGIEDCSSDTGYRTSIDEVLHAASEVSSDDDDDDGVEVEPSSELIMPAYTANVFDELVVFTLDVKNVDPSSIRLAPTSAAELPRFGLALRFDTIGAGFVPFSYGFDVQLCAAAAQANDFKWDPSDIEVERWDNNLTIQLPFPTARSGSAATATAIDATFRIGPDAGNRRDERLPDRENLPRVKKSTSSSEDACKTKKKKSKRPKRLSSGAETPTASAATAAAADQLRAKEDNGHAANAEDDDDDVFEKDRHSSGEDSAISCTSPPAADANSESSGGGAPRRPRLQAAQPPHNDANDAAQHAFAAAVDDGKHSLRSILKRNLSLCESCNESINPSESSFCGGSSSDAFSWADDGSLRSASVTEEEDPSGNRRSSVDSSVASGSVLSAPGGGGGDGKKSVRFNEVAKRHIYRRNASILGQQTKNAKKNAQKKRRGSTGGVGGSAGDAGDRRRSASEGDADLNPDDDDDDDEDDDDGADDSGCASSYDDKRKVPPAKQCCAAAAANGSGKAAAKNGGGGHRNKNVKQQSAAARFSTQAASNDLIFDLDI